jgi:hypothetical protein
MFQKKIDKDMQYLDGQVDLPLASFTNYPLRLVFSTLMPLDTAIRYIRPINKWLASNGIPLNLTATQRQSYIDPVNPDKICNYTTIDVHQSRNTIPVHAYRFFAYIQDYSKFFTTLSRFSAYKDGIREQMIRHNPRFVRKTEKLKKISDENTARAKAQKDATAKRMAEMKAAAKVQDERDAIVFGPTASTIPATTELHVGPDGRLITRPPRG